MTAERRERMTTLFRAALEKPAAERMAFLQEACRGDESLRRSIERLLAAEAEQILEGSLPEIPATSALEFTAGQILAQYRVETKIGEGGMGAVYRGYDTRLQRTVALKILAPGAFTDLDGKRRLLREARAASGLNHPNIVTIYEIGSDQDVDFIAMEYVEGKRLDELIPSQGMRPPLLLRYAVQIADALTRAHSAGIIHRDLKPSNIMVTPESRVKLLDFGLAKILEPIDSSPEAPTITAQALTKEGTVVGTTAYMSPEQALGHKLDARSDVFSFGSMLYEMVTGRRPFAAETWLALLTKIVNEDPQPPGQIAAVAPDLEKLVLRCLRKDAARRFQTMADLKVALEDLEIETSDRTLPAPESKVDPPRRYMTIRSVALVGAAILTGVAMTIIAMQVFRSSEIASRETTVALEPIPLTSYEGAELNPSFSPDGSQVAFSWNGPNLDNTDIYVKAMGSGPPLRLTTDPANDCRPSWSPDGRYIAFNRSTREGSAIYLIPPTGGPERKLVSGSGGCASSITWSPDGKHLAFARAAIGTDPQGIFLIVAEGGAARRLTAAENLDQHLHPAFSPDGRSLAYVSCVGAALACDTIVLLHLDTQLNPSGPTDQIVSRHGGSRAIAWTPSGDNLVFETNPAGGNRLWKVGLRSGAEPQFLSFAGVGARDPAIARTGNRMAFSRALENMEIWTVENGALARSPLSSTFLEEDPQFSPDGKRVVFNSARSGNLENWVANVDGSSALQLTHSKQSGSPHWSPDGRWIVYDTTAADGRYDINIVDSAGGAPMPVVRHPGDDYAASFSRDGKWIYFGSTRDNRNEIYKVSTTGGEPVRVTNQGGVIGFESVDGKSIYYTKHINRCGVPLFIRSLEGGSERQVLDSVCARAFQVTKEGIYYALPSGRDGTVRIHLLDPASGKSREVRQAKGRLFGVLEMAASPDGNTFLVVGSAQTGSDLYLVENFR